jgi:hypothetical protein
MLLGLISPDHFLTKPIFKIKSDFTMKHWEKSKKDSRQSDDREQQYSNSRKKKLKPVEKTKYRLKHRYQEEE